MVEGALVKSEAIPPMSLKEVKVQIHLIQEIMRDVMKENEHYGTIPGTTKPTLLKPGAEKLCLTFRFDPEYEIVRVTENPDYVSYTVLCTLLKIGGGHKIASGMGACNSAEVKYRYRWEDTGKPVPKQYWQNKDASLLGEDGIYRPRKGNGNNWIVFKRVENDNPRDLANTLLKMACKRALVAAVLNGTAASDIFTQDLEDMPAGKVQAEATIENNGEWKENAPTDTTAFWKQFYAIQKEVGEEKVNGVLADIGLEKGTIPPAKWGEVLEKLQSIQPKSEKAQKGEVTEPKIEQWSALDFLSSNLTGKEFTREEAANLLREEQAKAKGEGIKVEWLDPDGKVYGHRGSAVDDLCQRGLFAPIEGKRGRYFAASQPKPSLELD